MSYTHQHIDEGDVFATFIHPEEPHAESVPKHVDEGDVFASLLDGERPKKESVPEHIDEGDVFATFIHPDDGNVH